MAIKQEFLKFKQVLTILLNSGFLSSNKKVTHLNTSKFLDVYYSLINIKELIRNIEQVKVNPNNKIYIYIENRYLKSLANLLLTELKFAKNFISIIHLSRNIEKSTNLCLLLVLGNVNKKFCLESVRNNVNFIHLINDKNYQPITGNYNMYNNISDITKLVFIFALIDSLFSTVVDIPNK